MGKTYVLDLGTCDAATLLDVLRTIVAVNARQVPSLPPLYKSGVRYRYDRNEPTDRYWHAANEVFGRMVGNCKDLSCWRAAELRAAGERGADIAVKKVFAGRRVGDDVITLWHVVVRRADGSIEDPSRILGMRGH